MHHRFVFIVDQYTIRLTAEDTLSSNEIRRPYPNILVTTTDTMLGRLLLAIMRSKNGSVNKRELEEVTGKEIDSIRDTHFNNAKNKINDKVSVHFPSLLKDFPLIAYNRKAHGDLNGYYFFNYDIFVISLITKKDFSIASPKKHPSAGMNI